MLPLDTDQVHRVHHFLPRNLDKPLSSITMTTYIPALTLPDKIFASTAASILTPIVLGSGVGIGISSTYYDLALSSLL